jgi:hypothetical protein
MGILSLTMSLVAFAKRHPQANPRPDRGLIRATAAQFNWPLNSGFLSSSFLGFPKGGRFGRSVGVDNAEIEPAQRSFASVDVIRTSKSLD